MAKIKPITITDEWFLLFENPLYLRMMGADSKLSYLGGAVARGALIAVLLVGIHAILRAAIPSPKVHTIFFILSFLICSVWVTLACRNDLSEARESGALQGYLAAGRSHGDIALGAVFPTRIAEIVGYLIIIIYAGFVSGTVAGTLLLAPVLLIRMVPFIAGPWVFTPDAVALFRAHTSGGSFKLGLQALTPMFFEMLTVVLALSVTCGTLLVIAAVIGASCLGILGSALLALGLFGGRYIMESQWQQWRLRKIIAEFGTLENALVLVVGPAAALVPDPTGSPN